MKLISSSAVQVQLSQQGYPTRRVTAPRLLSRQSRSSLSDRSKWRVAAARRTGGERRVCCVCAGETLVDFLVQTYDWNLWRRRVTTRVSVEAAQRGRAAG